MGRIKRALTMDDFEAMEFEEIKLSAKFEKLLGDIELSGLWIIYGPSGHGKTTFALQLAKELARQVPVVLNSLEEGARKSLKLAIRRVGMMPVKNSFHVLNREPIPELKIRLKKQRSPKVIIIDSIQYTGMSKKDIIALQEEFPNKLFIFMSHAQGKSPQGRVAEWLKYHADVALSVYGYVVEPVKNRFEGKGQYIVWREGAQIL